MVARDQGREVAIKEQSTGRLVVMEVFCISMLVVGII